LHIRRLINLQRGNSGFPAYFDQVLLQMNKKYMAAIPALALILFLCSDKINIDDVRAQAVIESWYVKMSSLDKNCSKKVLQLFEQNLKDNKVDLAEWKQYMRAPGNSEKFMKWAAAFRKKYCIITDAPK
jgi:hypothetical protein